MQPKKGYRIQNYIYQTVRGKDKISSMIDVEGTPQDGDTLVYRASQNGFVFEVGGGGIYGADYDSASFTVGSSTTDYDVADLQTDLFDTVPAAKYLRITTTANIDIKINSTDNDAIPITTTESPFELAYNGITNIYITTAGSASNVRIVLIG